MLPFLYELLDADEYSAMAAHVEGCADCRAALTAAREQKVMLAEAVKQEHPEIVFKAPAKATPAAATPTVLMQRPVRHPVWLNRWAAAAAAILLIVVGAGGSLAYGVWRNQALALDASKDQLARARDDLSQSRDVLNQKKGQTQKEIRAIQGEIDALLQEWKSEEGKTRKLLEDKGGAQLLITGPQVPLAGAPNPYQVELRNDLTNNLGQNMPNQKLDKDVGKKKSEKQPPLPGGMPMQVRAVNQRTNKEVFKQELNLQANNRAQFVLPSDLAMKPGDEIVIEFQAPTADGKFVTLIDKLKLVFPEYVTQLTTDRPLYRPGETVRFRSLTLERFSLKPAQQKFNLRYRIVGPKNEAIYTQEVASQVVTGPKSEPIKGPDGQELHCFGAGEFKLPALLAPGQYTLIVGEVNDRFNEEKRTFQVYNWQPPRYKKDVQFDRDSYGPGDTVKMKVRAVPIQANKAGVANYVRLFVRVEVDGVMIMKDEALPIGNNGPGTLEFKLPNVIAKGTGSVTLECQDGGPIETLVRSLPLTLRDVLVEFYPEGGDLIAGVPNRVYFQARTPANKPADISGRIIGDGEVVARVATLIDEKEPGINQGLGSFVFTPQPKVAYWLQLDTPKGVFGPISLPEVKQQGVVLHLPQAIAESEIDVRLQTVGEARELLVGAYCRGRMVDFVKARPGASTQLKLKPMAGIGGVYRITVFEKAVMDNEVVFRPLAERLIYRKSAEKVDVAINSDRASYLPGDTVHLSLQATNEQRTLVPTMATVAVVDNSSLKMTNQKTARGLPTHFLLTTEVRDPEDLEYADVLLSDHPKSAVALDLLLGCQGWRRFAEQDPLKFQKQQQREARGQQPQANFLANSVIVPQVLDLEQKYLEKVDEGFVNEAVDLEKKLAKTETQVAGPADLVQTVNIKESSVAQVEQSVSEAAFRVRAFKAFIIQVGLGLGVLALLFVAFFCISVGLRRLSDATGNDRGWLGSGLALLGVLFLISLVGTFAFRGADVFDQDRFGGPNFKPMPALAPVAAKVDPIPPVDVVAIMDERAVAEVKGGKDSSTLVAPPPQPQKEAFERPGARLDANPIALPKLEEEREMRQKGDYQALLQKHLGRRVQLPPLGTPSVVRIYARQQKPNVDGGRDLAETLYWHPVLVMPDGRADMTFDLPDSATRFQVLILSNTFEGRLGTNRLEINCDAKAQELRTK
jgi:hypothetical protein